jgi:hypothetical protein
MINYLRNILFLYKKGFTFKKAIKLANEARSYK